MWFGVGALGRRVALVDADGLDSGNIGLGGVTGGQEQHRLGGKSIQKWERERLTQEG